GDGPDHGSDAATDTRAAGPGMLPGEPAVASLAGSAELEALEGGWRRRIANRNAQHAAAQVLYAELRRELGITELNVPGDGNCLYQSLREMFEPQLREFFGYLPTVDQMRNNLADMMQERFDLFNAGSIAEWADWFPGTTTGPPDRRLA